jgi:hypothetical protein
VARINTDLSNALNSYKDITNKVVSSTINSLQSSYQEISYTDPRQNFNN